MQDKLRQSDIDEMWASSHLKPEEGIMQSFKASTQCYTILWKNKPVCMFGVGPVADGCGSVWLLGTDNLSKVWLTFLSNIKFFIRRMLTNYKLIYNFIDCRNEKSINWIKWCGAEVLPPSPYGVEEKDFCYFSFKRGV